MPCVIACTLLTRSWREHEGALLGLAIILKRFRRAGAREIEEPSSPASFRIAATAGAGSTADLTGNRRTSFRADTPLIGPSALSRSVVLSPMRSPEHRMISPLLSPPSPSGQSKQFAIGRAHTMKVTVGTHVDTSDAGGGLSGTPVRGMDLSLSMADVNAPPSPPHAGVVKPLPSAGVAAAADPASPARSPRWDRRVKSESDRSGRASPRRHSIPSGRTSRFLYRTANLSARATRLLDAVVSHPTPNTVGFDRGLWFGGKLLAGLPGFVSGNIKCVAYPMLAHSQLSVRENAIRLYATYLSRSPVSEIVACLDDILDVLALKCHLSEYSLLYAQKAGQGGEDIGHTSSSRTLSNGLLPAFSAEGVLGLLAIVVRLVGAAGLFAEWHVMFETLFRYLGHPASTVRQITSKVFLEIMVTTKQDDSDPASALVSTCGPCCDCGIIAHFAWLLFCHSATLLCVQCSYLRC